MPSARKLNPTTNPNLPLATKLRPATLGDYIGQQHLLAPNKPLANAIANQQLHSMILWGPPGTGKTTLAHIICNAVNAHIIKLSAVMAGVKDIREAVAQAKEILQTENRPTVLFIDEVHRFNKSQQDAFLPYLEDGTLTLIGATTENPSFALNNALLSRARVYVLNSLTNAELVTIIQRALDTFQQEPAYQDIKINFPEQLQQRLAALADGDARRALNYLDIALQLAMTMTQSHCVTELSITEELLEQAASGSLRRFDKQGEEFYNQISALHKSVRGSDPDAALYWFARMIDGGCDPLYIARRVLRMASEDIGNADPRALKICLNAWQTFERLGSPEGELAIAQAIVYLAVCAKSNAVYLAYGQATQAAQQNGSLPVPMHIRNAPTKLMKNLGYGKNYRYAHDEPEAYAAGENYFPEEMTPQQFYHPVERGLELKIKQKLAQLRNK